MEFSEKALQRVREDRLLIDAVDAWLYDEISPHIGRRVLEIGCGMGNFAGRLTDRDCYVGTDISSESVAYVNEKYSAYPSMQARTVSATDPQFRDLASFKCDTVFSLNVFEHIEDHETAIRNAAAVLQPGGTLILVVPSHQWLYGSMDRSIGHYRRYCKGMMARLFQDVPLTCVAMKYVNCLGALGWFVNGRIRRQETPPQGQLRLFNKVVPWIRRFEKIVPVPVGISLLAVGKKP